MTYTVSGLPNGATFDPVTDLFNWPTGYSDAGNYVVTFIATNDGDGTGMPLTTTVHVPITVLPTYRPPIVTAILNQTMAHDTVLTLGVQSQDLDNEPETLSVVGLPAFGQFVDHGDGTGTFTFTPGAQDARNYTITVTASDQGGGPVEATSQSFVLTVTNPSIPPLLAPIGDTVAVVGQPFQVTVQASDLDQQPLTFSAMGLPGNATLTPSSVYD